MPEEDKKKLYVYVLLAALLGTGGGTGLQLVTSTARSDPCTGSQCRQITQMMHEHKGQQNERVNRLIADLSNIRKNIYTKEQIREKTHLIRQQLLNIKSRDEEMRQDIREINAVLANRPPQELLAQVANLELWRKYFEKQIQQTSYEVKELQRFVYKDQIIP